VGTFFPARGQEFQIIDCGSSSGGSVGGYCSGDNAAHTWSETIPAARSSLTVSSKFCLTAADDAIALWVLPLPTIGEGANPASADRAASAPLSHFPMQTGFAEWASHVGLEPGDTVHVRRVAPTRFVFTRWEAEGGSTSDGGSASMADDSDLAGFYGASRGGGSRGTSGRGNRGSKGDSGRGNSGGSRLPRLAARGTAQPEAPCGSQPQPQQQRQPQQRQRESQQLEHVLIKTGPSAFQTAADAIAAGELRRYVCASAAESLLLEVPSESALHPPPACNNMLHCSTWLAS
jgi:hypothetical protein